MRFNRNCFLKKSTLGAPSSSGPVYAYLQRMKPILFKSALAFLLLGGLATVPTFAQTASQDAKQAGQDAKDAGKNAGRAVTKTSKHAAHKVKQGVKSTVNKGANETEKGANKVKEKTE